MECHVRVLFERSSSYSLLFCSRFFLQEWFHRIYIYNKVDEIACSSFLFFLMVVDVGMSTTVHFLPKPWLHKFQKCKAQCSHLMGAVFGAGRNLIMDEGVDLYFLLLVLLIIFVDEQKSGGQAPIKG